MYGKEKTERKQLRIKKSAIECAEQLCNVENRSFNNLIETLIFDRCEKSMVDQIVKSNFKAK
jgi:hypothetical protein